MHRPGICRVSGDRIILNGTTLDEVERVHKETLKVVLDAVNARVEELEREAQLREAEQRRRIQAHADDVKQRAGRIKFGD